MNNNLDPATETAFGLLTSLPKLEPKVAVILSMLAPGETSEIVRLLKRLDSK
jgi:hypothetical protein